MKYWHCVLLHCFFNFIYKGIFGLTVKMIQLKMSLIELKMKWSWIVCVGSLFLTWKMHVKYVNIQRNICKCSVISTEKIMLLRSIGSKVFRVKWSSRNDGMMFSWYFHLAYSIFHGLMIKIYSLFWKQLPGIPGNQVGCECRWNKRITNLTIVF